MFTFSLRGTTPSVVLPSPFLIIVRERYWPIQGRCTHFLCNWTTRLDGCVVSFERGLVLTLLRKINSLATVHLSSITVGHLRRLILVSLLPRLASSQTAVQTSVFFNIFLFINLHKNWHACRYPLHLYLCQTTSKSDCAKRNERLLKQMPGGG